MKEYITLGILFSLMIAVLVGVWVVQSHFEAKAYNRLTSSDATTWEAMWVQLRVQAPPNR